MGRNRGPSAAGDHVTLPATGTILTLQLQPASTHTEFQGFIKEYHFRLVIIFPKILEKLYLTVDGRNIYFGSEDTN